MTSGSRSPINWVQTVERLDNARAKAVTARQVALLDEVYTPGSPARAADAGMIEDLISKGLRVSGAEHRVAAATVVGTAPIRIRVQDAMPPYSVLDGTGTVVGQTAAHAATARVLVLVPTPAGYRISAVESA